MLILPQHRNQCKFQSGHWPKSENSHTSPHSTTHPSSSNHPPSKLAPQPLPSVSLQLARNFIETHFEGRAQSHFKAESQVEKRAPPRQIETPRRRTERPRVCATNQRNWKTIGGRARSLVLHVLYCYYHQVSNFACSASEGTRRALALYLEGNCVRAACSIQRPRGQGWIFFSFCIHPGMIESCTVECYCKRGSSIRESLLMAQYEACEGERARWANASRVFALWL